MTNMIPRQVVQAPEPRGLRYGLLTAANGPLRLPVHGLAGGVTYQPVGCGVAHLYAAICPSGAAARKRDAKTFDPEADPTARDSFVVYASLVCHSAGVTPAELEDRVRRRLSDGEQTIVEASMATLLATGAAPLAPTSTTDITDVVAELEQYLYGQAPGDADYGYIGYLHASPRIAAYASDADLVVKDGSLLRTKLGTIWVFGGGYPDDGTIYASGQVSVWRSDDVFVNPAEGGFDKETNEYSLIAEREYAVSYDCVAASATFDWLRPS